MNDNSYKVIEVDINDVLPNRFQPRIQFDEEEILELSDSIQEHGVLQPLVVRIIGDKYEIIAGERRYKASVLAGKETVPVIVKDFNDKESAEVALIENIQRKNLTPIEEALSYKKILDMGYITQENLATKLGKSQSSVANKIRLLNLSDEVQEALLENKISERHARSLLRLKTTMEQNQMLNRIISERLTVRRTDEEIDKLLNNELNNIPEEKIIGKGEINMNNEFNQNPNIIMPQGNNFDIFGNTQPEVPQMSAPTVTMPSMEPIMPAQPEAPQMSAPTMPSMGPIMPAQPEVPQMSMPTMPSMEPIMPAQPEVPQMSMPTIPSTEPIMPAQPEAPQMSMPTMPSTEPIMPAQPEAPQMSMPTIPSTEPIMPAQPEVPQMSMPTMPSMEPIMPAQPEVPQMSMPTVTMPSMEPIMPAQPEAPQMSAPTVTIPSTEPIMPAQPEAPIFEMPKISPIIDSSQIGLTNQVDGINNEATVINEPVNIPEPIIITDYTKQYDPIMPHTQEVQITKVDFKEIVAAIRECSSKIEKFGYRIDVEEYDLNTLYQVIFKIEK